MNGETTRTKETGQNGEKTAAPVQSIVHPVFWSDAERTIYHADCLDVLPSVSVDVIVTDPPYGVDGAILNAKRKNGTKNPNARHNDWHDEPEWDRDINPAWCKAVCDAAPIVCWFGNWRRRDQVERAMPHPLRAEIVWAKDTHVGPPCPLAMRDERIWLFSVEGIKGNHFETTVWDEPIIPTWEHRRHKNEKPLGLMRRLIRFACKPGDVICDPFMGSGTTLRAAADLGHPCIGIDINKTYCKATVDRLRQGTLFAG